MAEGHGVDNALPGRQGRGQANAADIKIHVVFSPKAAEHAIALLQTAKELDSPVEHNYHVTIKPNGRFYIDVKKPDEKVWPKIEELIDP